MTTENNEWNGLTRTDGWIYILIALGIAIIWLFYIPWDTYSLIEGVALFLVFIALYWSLIHTGMGILGENGGITLRAVPEYERDFYETRE